MLYAKMSCVGERSNNEDAVGIAADGQRECFVVCDGLGGHNMGEAASRMAVETSLAQFGSFCSSSASPDSQVFLSQCFLKSQEAILQYQKLERRAKGMKTTMTILLRNGSTLQWCHIGDTRLYYFHNAKLVCRTLDHSIPQMLVRTGEIKEEQIRFHEDRNRLLRVLGAEVEQLKFDISEPVRLEDRQAFLLCTDGFWEWIDEKEMTACLKESRSPDDWLKRMEKVILASGSGKDMDNYSAAAVFQGEAWKGRFMGLF